MAHTDIFLFSIEVEILLIMVRLVYKLASTFQVCINIALGWNFKTLDEVPIIVTDFRFEPQTLLTFEILSEMT